METATSTAHRSFGFSSQGPGALPAQEPHQPAQGPSGAPRPEEQQHHKPFFYIQPSQPYLPMQSLQWPVALPMPVGYNPYYSYPGLGYGMPMMPHYQTNPYMEPPGFVVPHTPLHLMDYRRMLNPQYYHTMAYHARRLRYQQNAPARDVTSSEVQTEPLLATPRTSTPGSSHAEASGVHPACSGKETPSVPISQPLLPVSAVQSADASLELKDVAPPCSTSTPPNGSFVIQTEEVRIECRTTPVGLQLLHSHEAAEVSHRFSQDVVKRSSIAQGHVLQDESLVPADQSDQSLQACPDILLVGTPSSGERIPEESKTTDSVTLSASSQGATDGEETRRDNDLSTTSKNCPFKVVHLPFNPKYLEELQKMESAVWSMETTLVPSPDSLISNDHVVFQEDMLRFVPTADEALREDAPTGEVIPMIKMPPLAVEELSDLVPTAAIPGDEMGSEADICLMVDIPGVDEAPVSELKHQAEVTSDPLAPNDSTLEADRKQYRRETNVQDHQDTSFESLPAYLPSSSWLADFDNVYYYSKLPPTPKKQKKPLSRCGSDVPSRRRKLEMEYKDPPTVRKPKERYKPKGKVDRRSLSDHECFISRNFNENAFTHYGSKPDRLCTRCLAKPRVCTHASPRLDAQALKRKAVPFQQWNDPLLPTCEACKSHTKTRLVRNGSIPDVRALHHGHDTEGESSENGSCHTALKWRAVEDPRKINDLKRPLASKQNLEKRPAATYPKLRGKNCLCHQPQHPPVAWERLRHCPHGSTIREMDENCALPVSPQGAWRHLDQTYLTHQWQTAKSWKAANQDTDGSKNEARSPHFNKHKTSQPQGTRRKDTRC